MILVVARRDTSATRLYRSDASVASKPILPNSFRSDGSFIGRSKVDDLVTFSTLPLPCFRSRSGVLSFVDGAATLSLV
ncbi:unnamed protein product [Calypogeia fissa]